MQKFRSALDYMPPVIAFMAAALAVVGSPKWDSKATGLYKITLYGWVVLAVGALALVASFLVTARNKSEQAKQRKLKEQIAGIGKLQLLRAINHAVHPISNTEIWRPDFDSPESPVDLLIPARREVLAALNLNSRSPYADGSFAEIKWYSMFEMAATEGSKEIVTTLQIYSGYFTPEIIDAVTRLLYSDFLRYRLIHMRDIVLANTHRDQNRVVPFFWAAEDGGRNKDYEEFWQLLDAALVLCGGERTRGGSAVFKLG